MIRKIETDETGKIFHVYCINDDHDPHNPTGGLEIENVHAAFHEKMMESINDYAEMYIYDEQKGLRKREEHECKAEIRPRLKEFEEIPQGFIKKNLGKTLKRKKKGNLI
jgi:hypothetical protein